ncbi:DUF2283 domain-containing protein [Candidatus Daviesbacteria bacterium]|nr:DUF2283 domain-containing protein [Candidatus Daviesbacteria bacterium]
MKFKYSKKDDVLMIELNRKPIDYAEQSGDLIVHFSPKREAVLIEILDASEFLKQSTQALPIKVREDIFSNSSVVAHRVR